MMYCINPDSDEPIFCIFDQIGKDDEHPEIPYVDGNEFAKELLRIDGLGKKRIQVWINSEGGNVKEGYSIITAMLQSKTKVDVLVIGIAYSIMAVAALMGRKVEMMDFSTLMFHNPYNPDRTVDKGLEVVKQSLITAVASRSGKSIAEVASFMAATTFYTAEAAEKQGFVDCVIDCGEANAPRKTTDTKAQQLFGTKYAAKHIAKNAAPTAKKEDLPIIPTKTKHMKTVAKALGLNEEASEGAMLSQVSAFQAKAKTDEEKIDKLQNSVKVAEDALAEFKKKKSEDDEVAAKAKAKSDEDAVAAAEKLKQEAKASFKVSAKAKIQLTIKDKGLNIADTAVNNYVDMAGETDESLTKVIETIEAIPSVTKAANAAFAKPGADKTGIPLIPTMGTDKTGAPIAGDTSSVVSAINSFKFPKI